MQRIKKRLTYIHELGALHNIFDQVLVKSAITTHVAEAPDKADVYRKCMTDNIEENMKPVQPNLLFVCCSFILLLALVILCYEMCYGRGW